MRTQRGAATLVVVMVLFFVLSLVAAYASRNLIFEQRTSANQYRSTQAFEAAEAGLEWAVTMLNSGRVDDDCLPTTDVSRDNFRQRYLSIDPTTGIVTRKTQPGTTTPPWAACSFDGAKWVCKCPTGDLVAGSLPAAGPAFALRFVTQSVNRPGVVRLEINGCNSFDLGCLKATQSAGAANCLTTLCSLLALHSGLKAPPVAAITARGNISGSALSAANPSSANGGITLHAGGDVLVTTLTLSSAPGAPASASIRKQSSLLAGLEDDDSACTYCSFSSVFGLRPATYQDQPAALQLDCSSVCDAAAVNALLGVNRDRIVVLKNAGGLRLSSSSDVIGSATEPVILVIEGPLMIEASASSAARIHGLVYADSASLDSGEIRGALVAANDVAGNGDALVSYEADMLNRLRLTSGSFVRVPGSWRDFQ